MRKPYSFVPFLQTKEFNPTGEKLKGKIYLIIEALTPVHISSDYYEVNKKQVLYKPFYKLSENYSIPGTAMKGIVRGIAECISYSCISTNKKNINKLPKGKKRECKINTKTYENPCIVCSIFGAMGKRSKVKFSDFSLIEGKSNIIEIPILRSPNNSNSNYFKDNKNQEYKGYKIYSHGVEKILQKGNVSYEFITKNSKFSGSIIYEDMTIDELSLLAFSLGITGDFHHKIGYGKPAYYGSIKVYLDEEKTTNSEEILKAAMNYKNNSPLDIKKNIEILNNEYNYNNAKKISDWHNGMY